MVVRRLAVTLSILAFAVTGCAQDSVPGVARVLNGATPSGASASAPATAAAAGNGLWWVSPSTVQVNFKEIVFYTPERTDEWITLTDCTATYDRAAPTLSRRLDCAFAVPPGSYSSMGLTFDPTVLVLVDDPTTGLYTDGVGVVTTPPAGGAKPSPLVSLSPGNRALLAEPLVVAVDPIEIDVVMSGMFTVVVSVEGSRATLMSSFGVQIYATPSTVGAAAYYSSATSTLAFRQDVADAPVNMILFSENPTTPSYAFLVPGPAVSACTVGNSGTYQAFSTGPGELDESGQTIGGYLGRDSTGTICFALPTDPTYREYSAIYRMAETTNLGDTTTLQCASARTVPAPTSGTNWSSGCPTIEPEAAASLTLVAN